MQEMKMFQAKNRQEWRDWLALYHQKETEIWLVYYKKHTKKESVSYIESVEEALCFGWIDGTKKRIDEERYTHRFTIRRPKSQWSKVNIRLAEKLIKEKKMSPAGMAFFENRIPYKDDIDNEYREQIYTLSPELKKSLQSHTVAWGNFQKLAPSHQKQYIAWIQSAKTEPTRLKRLAEAIAMLVENKKLGMK